MNESEKLTDEARHRLGFMSRAETAAPSAGIRSRDLIQRFHGQVEAALKELRTIDVGALGEGRKVGRAGLPSTVLGLLVHAAEHVQRHVGQLLVTVRVLTRSNEDQALDIDSRQR